MKIPKSKLLNLLPVTVVMGAVSLPSHADLLVNFSETGPGIVTVEWSGSFDTLSVSPLGSVTGVSGLTSMMPNAGEFISPTPGVLYDVWSIDSTPLIYGTGGLNDGGNTAPGSDDISIGSGLLSIPDSYVSGSTLSGSATFAGTIMSLGLTPGSYSTVGPTGDKITYFVSSDVSPIPEVTGSSILLGFIGLTLVGRRRKL